MEALGTRGAVHVRGRRTSASVLFGIAEKLAEAQRASESWLVVNERIDIALACGARGIQLTSQSMRVADARLIAGTMAVGASVHDAGEALAASREGASWLIAGHVFATPSHAVSSERGVEFIEDIAWRVDTPVIAIGGIVPASVPALRRAGAYGVAAIRGIWDAPNAGRAASDYLLVYDTDGDL
jgi:thiamine-phosphate diphosphorylase